MLRQRSLGDQRMLVNAVLVAHVMESADVGMIEAGNRSCFSFKSFAQIRFAGEMVRKNFDGDDTVQTRVPRAVQPHPSLQPQWWRGFRRALDVCREGSARTPASLEFGEYSVERYL